MRRILIIEDNSRDADTAARIATKYGLPIAVNSLSGAMDLLRNQSFDLLIVDLTLRPIGDDKGSFAKATLDALRLVITTTPVIVTSGTADENIIRDVMLYRWAYIDKEQSSFEAELEAAIRDQFEDSGGGRIIDSRQDLILSSLQRIETNQKEMQAQSLVLQRQLEQVCRIVLGYRDENGVHVPGCYESHQPIAKAALQLRVNAWHVAGVAVIAVVTSVVSSIVAIAFGK